jgi:hypothetical protein
MANGPRVFYCQLVSHHQQSFLLPNIGEMKISARGPKSAAETFIMSDFREALRYKPGIVQVRVRESGVPGPGRLFAIETTVKALEIRRPNV